ncbi:hypothetical protein MB02_05370 [Croceicoccus estronivorus]|uniref:sensor histidine kinase n=1 Tax=Croceicoccus estronivorus TaxID=1172626 RepID=UPI00083607C2|nr:sensor histidine kinase [Croceicoccus estronivorus]OCC25092.1 hypothetical protein MB02_05370 [Croceicoccus estronivorus]
MQRLAQFDVSRQFVSRPGKIAAQLVFGCICAIAMIGIRRVFDIWAPTAGPFALIYPTILLATLYGHLLAGLTAFALTFFWAWYAVLPAQYSLDFAEPADAERVVLNALCCMVLVVFSEAFRRAAQSTMEQIQGAADRRLTLLAELEHRTKNNFALVASMLEIQKRRLPDTSLHGPLDDAAGRVRTFADAYSHLASEHWEESEIAIKPYLNALLDRIERAAVPAHVQIYREIDPLTLPGEIAVAIGLYVNEAMANCLKYAFPEERKGTIGVYFHVSDGEWRLTIDDDGAGLDGEAPSDGGLGSNLMRAFAQQAGATHSAGAVEGGYRAELIQES